MSELAAPDVPGPSALGGGWRRSLELLYLIAVTDFKKTYFGTVLGYLWSLARPLMLFGVLLVGVHARLPPGLATSRTTRCSCSSTSCSSASSRRPRTLAVGSIVGHEAVVRKTQFPRLVIPLSVVLTSFFNLALNLVVAFVFVLAFGVSPAWTWLLVLPLLVVAVRDHHRGGDDRLLAVPALSRRGDHLDACSRPRCSTRRRSCTRSAAVSPHVPRRDRAQPAGADLRPGSALVTNPSGPWPWQAAAGGPVRLAVAVALYVAICGARGVAVQPRGAADRRGAVARVAAVARARIAPARTIATSVTAGICQSQSSGACAM